MEYCHTKHGIANKHKTEAKFAQFLTLNDVEFDHDRQNTIRFTSCRTQLQNAGRSARPDFFLPGESARLGALVFIENDEHAHRRYSGDFKRVLSIKQALSLNQDESIKVASEKIVMIRMNPHTYMKGDVLYNPPLESVFTKTLKVIRHLTAEQVQEGPDLQLVYIHYDQHKSTKHIEFEFERLHVFMDTTRDSPNFTNMLLLQDSVMAVH